MTFRQLVFVLLAFLVVVTPACTSQTISEGKTVRHRREVSGPEMPAEVTRAEAAMARKEYTAAEKDLIAATAKDPKDYRAWFDLGYVYNATDRQHDAIDAYRKSIAANPEIFESTLNLGILLARANDPDAEKILRDATKLKPTAHQEQGWYRAWLTLGHVIEKSKPAEAVEAFQYAAKLQPKEPEPRLSAGLALEGLKQFSQAAAEYHMAAELEPKSREALAGVVNAYSQAGELPQAETALRRLLALDPDNATAHVQLGRILASEKKWQDATAELEQGLKLSPGDVEAERQLASIYLDQRDYTAALPHIQAALQAAPKDASLHHWLGQSLLQEKHFPEAQKELLAAVQLKPDLGEAYGDLAFAASENKNYPLVLQALDVRAKLLPEMPVTYFLRATAYDHMRDGKKAAENYHKFLDVSAGRHPEEEWQAKHRLIAIEPKK
jgi:tetratricopeptide (TPR) repeat protein